MASTPTSKIASSSNKSETPNKKIHSFFKPRGTPTKKATPTTVLSPTAVEALKDEVLPSDVQERIARNRAAARAKLLACAAETAAKSGSTDLFGAGLEPTWRKALTKTLKEPFIKDLSKFVTDERARATVYPAPANVFSAFNHSAFSRTKIVIVGQDPYHGPGQAHGMSFSVMPGVSHPPSLRNIFTELSTDISGFAKPKSGCLEKWANQGVLLLNAVLTVRKGEPASHQGRGWERFTDTVVQAINARDGPGVVFMLWGGYAKKKGARINKKRHCVLYAPHPSPLSASRGWFGSSHFSKANEFLVKTRQTPIDWTL